MKCSDEPRILEVCNRCGGTGWEPVPGVALAVRTCWTCGGSGQPRRNRVSARYACRGCAAGENPCSECGRDAAGIAHPVLRGGKTL